jgi:hypothetical protein
MSKSKQQTGLQPELKPQKPLFGGKKHPGFRPGYDSNRHIGGGHSYVKVHQRLSVVMNTELGSPAPEYVTKILDLVPGSTWAQAVTRAALMAAVEGDTAAMRFVHDCVEQARVKPKFNINISADALNQAMHAADNLLLLANNEEFEDD